MMTHVSFLRHARRRARLPVSMNLRLCAFFMVFMVWGAALFISGCGIKGALYIENSTLDPEVQRQLAVEAARQQDPGSVIGGSADAVAPGGSENSGSSGTAVDALQQQEVDARGYEVDQDVTGGLTLDY